MARKTRAGTPDPPDGDETPQSMMNRAEALARAGDYAGAVEVARRAVERFPDSERCALAAKLVLKNQHESEIRELNAAIRMRPEARHFERLACIYLESLSNRNRALELAQEGLLKFPQSEALHVICARVRLARFHTDQLANDARQAIEHSQLALASNKSSVQALSCLARVYAEIGSYDKAKSAAESYLRLVPDDAAMTRLLACVVTLTGQSVADIDAALKQIEDRQAVSPESEAIRRLFVE